MVEWLENLQSLDADTVLQSFTQARFVGGRWDKIQRVWLLPCEYLAGMKLEKFIAVETKAEVEDREVYRYRNLRGL